MYSNLFNLLAVCSAILTIGAIGIVVAFMFGFFGTWLRATKKDEWVFNYSLRAIEFENETNLPVDNRKAIYFPSMTACMTYVIATSCLFKWLVINPNAQDIYNKWFLIFRSSYGEGALNAKTGTTLILLGIVVISMGFAMRIGRRLKIKMLQKKSMKNGYVVPIRSRCILVYPVCFICTFAVAMGEKVSKKFKKATSAKR